MPETASLSRPFDALLVGLINFCQARLPPLKGFRCAHRARHGGRSCAQFVKEVIASGGGCFGAPTD